MPSKATFIILWESFHAIICIIELFSVMYYTDELLHSEKIPQGLILIDPASFLQE